LTGPERKGKGIRVKILVPVKRVVDPDNANKVKVSADGSKVTSDGLEQKINPFDEYAAEAALRLTENGATAARDGEVVVVTIGPKEAAQTLRGALAMGADRAVLVEGSDDALDANLVAAALAKLVAQEKPDLVLMGKQQVDGDSNQVGQLLAEALDWPMATFAATIEVTGGGAALVVGREVDGGVLRLEVTLPAVVTVDLRIVASKAVNNGVTPATHTYPDTPRYASLKGIMAAKKKPIVETALAALGVAEPLRTQYVKFELPPKRAGGVKVESVQDLVQKLHSQAKVI
jgi:electron transfer flavoprotein beta subunit